MKKAVCRLLLFSSALTVVILLVSVFGVYQSSHQHVQRTPKSVNSLNTIKFPGTTKYLTNITSQNSKLVYKTNPDTFLKWTSVLAPGEKDSYNFVSAYFDSRSNKDLVRPAVIVMGYTHRIIKKHNIFCLFTYEDGSEICRGPPVVQKYSLPCWQLKLQGWPFHFFCQVEEGEKIPVSVKMSYNSDCSKPSEAIEVLNRDKTLESIPKKKFGVCIGAPLVQENKSILKDIVEFLEISKIFGVDLVAMYFNKDQIDASIITYLRNHYNESLRLIHDWPKFEKWKPLHYYGQLLLIPDCFYRHMYEVEYMAVIDIDEIIIPVKHNSWSEMVADFNLNDEFSTFSFQNSFFIAGDKQSQVVKNCTNAQPSKYVTNTKRVTCNPGYEYRPKLLTRAKFIYEPGLHWECAKVKGHGKGYNVPPEIGFLGHYRNILPDDCKNKPTKIDEVILKNQDRLQEQLCHHQLV